jgi:hypothetical protein
MSEGVLKAETIEPRHFVSDTKAKKDARIVKLTYDGSRMPRLTATPPYDADDLKEVKPAQQKGTQDPVSAFLLPVNNATANPCGRTVPVFDGKRRYNLTFTYQTKKKITPEGWTKSLTAVVCTVRYEAIAPVEKKRKFTNMLRRNDDMKIWLAPFDEGRLYMPVRFEIRTPIGSAVMQLHNVKEQRAPQETPAESASLTLAAQEDTGL